MKTMLKRLLALTIALVMVIGLMPWNATSVFAAEETPVAKVGDVEVTSLQEAIDAAEDGQTILLLADVSMSDILVINKAITLDGNGKTLTSTAGRAINVSGANGVTIKNLTINAKGERAINIIQNATNVTIENVTATAANYTVNVANSASAAVVTINESTLNGLCTVNVSAAGAKVAIDKSTINCNDNNTTVGESYAALSLNKDGKGGSIIATNTTVNVTEGSDSTKGRNGAENGVVTINGSTEGVTVTVAVITYAGSDYYYGYTSLEGAIAAAKAGDIITLLTPIVIEKGETKVIDLKGATIVGTPTEAKAYAVITNYGNLTIKDSVGGGAIVCDHKLAGSTGYAVNTIVNAGTLTIENGVIENKSTAAFQIGYAIDNNSTSYDAVVVVKGGEVKASGSNYYDGIRLFCNNLTKQNSVTVEGGKVSTIWMQNPSDGAEKNTKDVKGNVTITGGTVGVLSLEPSSAFEASITDGYVGEVSYFQTAEGRDLTGFITGGTFGNDVSAFVADGLAASKNADGTYGVVESKPVLPNAEIKELGATTVDVESYYVYDLVGDKKLSEATEPFDLQIALEFLALDTPEQAAANYYGDYTTDFFIRIDGIEGGSFVGDGCYLAGYYPEYGAWVKIPLDGFTIEEGQIYPMITSAGFDFSYEDICASVKDFVCGIYFSKEVLKANPDLSVTLELGLSENADAALNGEYISVDSRTYYMGLPNAEIKELGATTVDVESYYVYDLVGDKKLSEATEPFDLLIALEFLALDTPEQAAANLYGDYTTDFFIRIDGIEGGSFVGDGCYLAGYYPEYGAWVKIPLDGFTIEEGQIYPMITAAGFDFSYEDICSSVKDFICGIYFSEEVLKANPDLSVTLELGLSENADAALNAEYICVDSRTYNMGLPDATVNTLGAITVTGEHQEYDLVGDHKLTSSTDPFDLQIAMEFIAKDTKEEAEKNFYANYTTDFFIEISGIENGSFVGNDCYLAGWYGNYSDQWVVVPLDGFTIEDGKLYPVITSVGFDFSYEDICDLVKHFKCGIYLSEEVLADNPELTVTLRLGLSVSADAALDGRFIELGEYVFGPEDLNPDSGLFDLAGSTMTLGNTLEINFVVNNSDIKTEGNYVVITKQYADERGLVTKTIPQSEWKRYNAEKQYFSFTVSAKEMNDPLTATVYNAEGVQISNVYYDSVAGYCVRMLGKEAAKDAPVAEKMALYVDMVNYGAAAQVEWEYNVENLANAELTEEQKALATVADETQNILEKGTGYAGTTLSLKENILLNIVFKNSTINEAAYAMVSFDRYTGRESISYRVDASEFKTDMGPNYTYVQINKLKVADYEQAVTVELYDAEGNVISTVVDSIESYLDRKYLDTELYPATLAFCQGAYTYLKINSK